MKTRSGLSILFAALAAVAGPGIARASPGDLGLELGAGIEMLGREGVTSEVFHLDVLAEESFGTGRVRPLLALGGMLSSGALQVSDPRALDGTVALGITALGPEARVGLRFGDNDHVNNRLYASLALARVFHDRRLDIEPVGTVRSGSRYGMRVALGASWFSSLVHANYKSWDVLAVLVPGQGELVWQRDLAGDRFGVFAGWGL